MRVQDIVERLTVLGLDPQEAAIYVHLSVAGPCKAGDVAQVLGLQRTETYRTLDTLVQRGFVRATDERPSRFEAAPAEALFQAILAAEAQRLASTRQAEADIAPALRSLTQRPGPEAAKNTFKVVQGRSEVLDVLERLLRGARSEVLWVDTHRAAPAIAVARGVLDLLARRVQDGVRVRAMLRAGPDTAAALQAAGLGEAARQLATEHPVRIAVIDNAEVLVWLTSDEDPGLVAERDTAMWSDATDLATTERSLLDALWHSREARELPPASGRGGRGSGDPARGRR